MYRLDTAARLPVTGAAGKRDPDDRILLEPVVVVRTPNSPADSHSARDAGRLYLRLSRGARDAPHRAEPSGQVATSPGYPFPHRSTSAPTSGTLLPDRAALRRDEPADDLWARPKVAPRYGPCRAGRCVGQWARRGTASTTGSRRGHRNRDLALDALRQDLSLHVTGWTWFRDAGRCPRQGRRGLGSSARKPEGATVGRLDLVLATRCACLSRRHIRRRRDRLCAAQRAGYPGRFREMARVAAGGRLACSKSPSPGSRLSSGLCPLLLPTGASPGPALGRRGFRLHRSPPFSVSLLTPEEIASLMKEVGWRDVRYRRLMLGTVAVHAAIR